MVPRYINHWPPTAPPTLIPPYVPIATAFGDARSLLLNREIELPTAKGLAIMTLCRGLSSMSRPVSVAAEPMVKLPSGTTTVSGHLSHSLKLSFGSSVRSRSGDNGPVGTVFDDGCAAGCAGRQMTAPKMPNSSMADHAT